MAGFALVALFGTGGSPFVPAVAGATVVPLLVRNAVGRLSVDRASLVAGIRKDLSLNPVSRVTIDSMPGSFNGPDGKKVSASLSREGTEPGGRYLYRLNIMEGGVARESFYLHVRIRGLNTASEDRLEAAVSSSSDVTGLERREGTLVHSGDSVRVTATGSGFLIRFRGISQSNGGLGDSVSVINPLSGSRMVGQVSGHDRIVLHLSGNGL